MASLADVQRLSHDLLSSLSHVNNAPALLSILSKSLTPPPPSPECLLEALLSLQAFFVPLLRSGELSSAVAKKANENLRGKTDGDDKPSAEAIYKSWLWDKYNEFLDILLQIISHSESLQSLQVAALDALMEFTRQEHRGKFSNRVYGKLCSTIVQSEDLNSHMLDLLVTKYSKYFDVCFYTCVNLRKLSTRCGGQEHKDEEMTSSTPEIRSQSMMSNICDLLSCLNSPKLSDKDLGTVMGSWVSSKDKHLDENNDQRPITNDQEQEKDTHEKVKLKPKEVKKLKTKMTTTWLTFLRLPLPVMVYKKVLAQLHKTVIPNVSNPILLSDFLTDSYNKGGVISVMALNGLYLLITQYGLEYPEFYNKLYALLEPSIFVAKYRARFFELLDVCLKSPHLPSYLAAAFAKKLGRMALTSAPAGALIVIALVYNLLRRHPSINCLVHRDSVGAESMLSNSNGGLENESGISESQGMQKQTAESPGVDPFVATEPDPANCNALKSSLWEVETLRRHYCPAVSKFVAALEADLTVREKTMELAIKDFSSGSYTTIFAEEVGKRMKQVPLAFYKSTPTMLFPKSPVAQVPGEVDFAGWTFGYGNNDRNCDGQHNSEFDRLAMNMNGVRNEMHDTGKQFEEEIRNSGHNKKNEAKLHQKKRQKAH